MLFVPWWLVRLVNSVISFTLIVFTIPLAFDVGGRDCGLVCFQPRRFPGSRSEYLFLKNTSRLFSTTSLLVFCVMLMVDVFLSVGDVLFRTLLPETWSATITPTMDPWPHRLHSKLHYHFNPNRRPKRLHHKLLT